MTASFVHCYDFATIPDERVEIFQFFFGVVLFIKSLSMDWIKIKKKKHQDKNNGCQKFKNLDKFKLFDINESKNNRWK